MNILKKFIILKYLSVLIMKFAALVVAGVTMTTASNAIQFFTNTSLISPINGAGVFTEPESDLALVRFNSPATDYTFDSNSGIISDQDKTLTVAQSGVYPYLQFTLSTPVERFQVSSDGYLTLNGVSNGFYACRMSNSSIETWALTYFGEIGPTDGSNVCIEVTLTGTTTGQQQETASSVETCGSVVTVYPTPINSGIDAVTQTNDEKPTPAPPTDIPTGNVSGILLNHTDAKINITQLPVHNIASIATKETLTMMGFTIAGVASTIMLL